MGFFSGLFGENKHASFDNWSYDQKVDPSMRGLATDVGGGALQTGKSIANTGTTPGAESLYNSANANSQQQFKNATGNAMAAPQTAPGQNTAARMAALQQSYGRMLAQMAGQHQQALLGNRYAGNNMAVGTGLKLSGVGDETPQVFQPGLFTGLGTRLTAAGIKTGIKAIGSLMGGAGAAVGDKIGSDAIGSYAQEDTEPRLSE